MYKECEKCGKRLMIIQEGFPPYTYGSFTIYGCPDCGNVVYEFDKSNHPDNRCKMVYDPSDISRYHVSN